MKITAEKLKEVISYDPETGIFTWKHRKARGGLAGHLDSNGYLTIRVDWILYGAHRLAWLYMTGSWPSGDIDHKDGDSANNRWANLRDATVSQNMANSKLSRGNTSGVKGVHWDKDNRKWRARIKVKYKSIHLGEFDCPAAAHFAYLVEADKQFGEFARAS